MTITVKPICSGLTITQVKSTGAITARVALPKPVEVRAIFNGPPGRKGNDAMADPGDLAALFNSA